MLCKKLSKIKLAHMVKLSFAKIFLEFLEFLAETYVLKL